VCDYFYNARVTFCYQTENQKGILNKVFNHNNLLKTNYMFLENFGTLISTLCGLARSDHVRHLLLVRQRRIAEIYVNGV